jgi:DNA-binding MarR family transcriptional regulator
MQHGYTLSEIGRELGLHYSTVSKIVRREKKEPEKSQAKT